MSLSGTFTPTASLTSAESNFGIAIGSGDPMVELRNNAVFNSAANNGTPPVVSFAIGTARHPATPTIGAYENSAALNPLEAWRQFHFGTPANTGDAADDFDFDLDGLTNLVEFAFGLNPKAAVSAALPAAVRAGNDLGWSFTPSGISGITFLGEISTILAPNEWTLLPDSDPGPGLEFRIPATGPRVYFRCRISVP